MSNRLAIIAGSGQFPHLVARSARSAGCSVCILGLRDNADPELRDLADSFRWIPVARVGRWIKLARKFDADHIIFAGGVRKTQAFSAFRILKYLPDLRTIKIWFKRAKGDRRNLAILSAVSEELEQAGFKVENSVKYCRDALAKEELMTRTKPSELLLSDMEFAWPIALKVAAMDIGQSIAVREKDIIAIEAIEGTDQMIRRAGSLARGGWSLIKVAQANQDMRFDVPTVGPDTVRELYENGGKAIMVQAGKTLIIEKEKTIELADRYSIAIIGRNE